MKNVSLPPNKRTLVFIVFCISLTLLLIERFTQVSINNILVRLFLYILCATFITIFIGKMLFRYTLLSLILVFGCVTILCVMNAYLRWEVDWKTQTVIYIHKSDKSKTVEFQMCKPRFAFGYRKRIVMREKIAPFLDYNTDVDTTKLAHSNWQRVDNIVNNLHLNDFKEMPSE